MVCFKSNLSKCSQNLKRINGHICFILPVSTAYWIKLSTFIFIQYNDLKTGISVSSLKTIAWHSMGQKAD